MDDNDFWFLDDMQVNEIYNDVLETGGALLALKTCYRVSYASCISYKDGYCSYYDSCAPYGTIQGYCYNCVEEHYSYTYYLP